MVSTYHGIETGRRAIEYFRKGMEIAGINTGSTEKDGYSRQVVNATASAALSTTANVSALGTGVTITAVERMRSLFLDAQMRRVSTEAAYWRTMTAGAERVDGFIIDVNAKGLDDMLDSFWTALQTVQKSPSESMTAVRSTLLQESDSLVHFVGSLYKNYTSYREELNASVESMVWEANSLIDQIAVLNDGIRTVRLAGGEPNELLDRRDLLADRLCTLTGATVGTDVDELDGDYRIYIGGALVVQGSHTRRLVLVENAANSGFYDVQIEYNQYDVTSDAGVAGVIAERRADDLRELQNSCTMDGTHELTVVRMADEAYWTVGHGAGQLAGGSRLDEISDAKAGLGIEGSFALQVGSAGVRVLSEAFAATPPGRGVVLGPPGAGEATKYSFRIAAGDFESTITLSWNDSASEWEITDTRGNAAVSGGAGGALTVEDLAGFIGANYASAGITASSANDTLTIESTDRQILSVTDMLGNLASSSGLANGNPVVMIEVTAEDSLQTIANKINNAYRYDRTDAGVLSYSTYPDGAVPQTPDEWLHASVEHDGNGYYLCLTSNTAGEASRINVLTGSICGDDTASLHVARLLGLVENDGANLDVTSYIQFAEKDGSIITRSDGDVFVDDAYVIYDGREYLSSGNDFKLARAVSPVGDAAADKLAELAPGIRFFLAGEGTTTITVRHPLTGGEIFASIKLRDDVLLEQMDTFDDIMYQLSSQFNALHYSGYGTGEYEELTGMGYFQRIACGYGAFSKLALDEGVLQNPNRVATSTGDGTGKSLGCGNGVNMLSLAQLKQDKLFLNGTADFNGLYLNFIADLGSFGAHSSTMLDSFTYVSEQIELQRQSIMGVNPDEEMLNLVNLNSSFNMASQYISTLLQVIDQIISGVGRVGL